MSNTLSEINISLTKMMNDLKEIHILPAMPKNFDSLIYKLSDWLLHHNANNFTVLLDTCSGEYAVLDEWTSDELDAGNILAIVISQCSDKLYQKIQNNRDLYNDCVYNIYDKLHSLAVVKRNLSNMEHVKDLLSLISGSEDDSYALTLANVFQVKDSNSLKEDVLTELSKNMIISDSSYRLAYTDSLPEQYSRKLSRRLCLYNFLSLLSDEQYYIVRFFVEQSLWNSPDDTAASMQKYLYLNFLSIQEMYTYYASYLCDSPSCPALCISHSEYYGCIGDNLEDFINTPERYHENTQPDVLELNPCDYYKITQMKQHLNLKEGKNK